MSVLDLTVREFIALCRAQGFHFTANWVSKRVNDLHGK
jgi:hypothetical protein